MLDEDLEKDSGLWETGKFSIGDRVVLMTWVVGATWDWLLAEKSDLFIKSFSQVEISLAIDRLEDLELKIRGLEDMEIGDWNISGLDCNLDRLGKTGIGN